MTTSRKIASRVVWCLAVVMWTTVASGEVFVYEQGTLRDPMRPLVDGEGNLINYGETAMISTVDMGSLQLEGVLWDLQDPVAIVNGDVVHVGDYVEDIQITEIHEEYIVVESGGDIRTIFLFPEGEGAL